MIDKFEHLLNLNFNDTIEAVIEYDKETFSVKGSFVEFRGSWPIYGDDSDKSHIIIATRNNGRKIVNLHATDETLSVHRTRIVLIEKYKPI
jgi:hypothetical protein